MSGFNQLMVHIFETAFAVSTLAPIILYIYTDIRIMSLQARQQIELQKKALITTNGNQFSSD